MIHASSAWGLLAATVASSALSVADLQAQTPEGRESVAVASHVVEPGEVRGVVFDAETGDPIEGAQVRYGNVGVVTDPVGGFHLSDVPAETTILIAEFIGYRRNQVELGPAGRHAGHVVRFAMEKRLPDFGCDGNYSFGVRVKVRDALTGQAPIGHVVLRVRQDSLVVWAMKSVESRAEWVYLNALLGPAGFGPHERSTSPLEAEVGAPGYAAWNRGGIVLTPGSCGGALTEVYPVWLLRTDPERRAFERVPLVPSNKR